MQVMQLQAYICRAITCKSRAGNNLVTNTDSRRARGGAYDDGRG